MFLQSCQRGQETAITVGTISLCVIVLVCLRIHLQYLTIMNYNQYDALILLFQVFFNQNQCIGFLFGSYRIELNGCNYWLH